MQNSRIEQRSHRGKDFTSTWGKKGGTGVEKKGRQAGSARKNCMARKYLTSTKKQTAGIEVLIVLSEKT